MTTITTDSGGRHRADAPAGDMPRRPAIAAGGAPSSHGGAPSPDGGERDAVVRRRPAERLVSLLAPGSFEAEQYRALRHVLEHRRRTGPLAAVAVSSAAAGEGKTTTAINLAGTLAQSPDARVLLVDADVRLPSVAQQLGLEEPSPGLVDVVTDPRLTLRDVVRRWPGSRLSVLPSGRLPESPYEVLKSPRLGGLLEQARHAYEWVIVDAPPLLPVPDGRILARWVDAILLVVAAHRTPRKLVAETLNLLEPGIVAGFVLNGDDQPFSGYYGSYYGYGHARHHRAGAGRWGTAARAGGPGR